jgi:hypothetical protein
MFGKASSNHGSSGEAIFFDRAEVILIIFNKIASRVIHGWMEEDNCPIYPCLSTLVL